jgi:hypothetical protein
VSLRIKPRERVHDATQAFGIVAGARLRSRHVLFGRDHELLELVLPLAQDGEFLFRRQVRGGLERLWRIEAAPGIHHCAYEVEFLHSSICA